MTASRTDGTRDIHESSLGRCSMGRLCLLPMGSRILTRAARAVPCRAGNRTNLLLAANSRLLERAIGGLGHGGGVGIHRGRHLVSHSVTTRQWACVWNMARQRTWTATLGWILNGGSDRRVSQTRHGPHWLGWFPLRMTVGSTCLACQGCGWFPVVPCSPLQGTATGAIFCKLGGPGALTSSLRVLRHAPAKPVWERPGQD
jgi:hypothetical protein